MSYPELYQIALTFLEGVGPINGQNLVSHCGSAEAVFKEEKRKLELIPNIGAIMANRLIGSRTTALQRAEQEMTFLQTRNDIEVLFYADKDFPSRLKFCADCPLVIYYTGTDVLNDRKILSMVGTRKITEYGHRMVNDLIKSMSVYDNITIVSGLAYGVDTAVHKACVKHNVSTIGVLGHGLDVIYPATNKGLAQKMRKNGGLLSEFPSETKPDRENFPKRNRVVAGLADATIVIESGKKGGSLITADIAHSYSRDVFAVPGKVGDIHSEGCNKLIREKKAFLIEKIDDVFNELGWERQEKNAEGRQASLFKELTDVERIIVGQLQQEKQTAELLSVKSSLPLSEVNMHLLNLELKGIVRTMPGNYFTLN